MSDGRRIPDAHRRRLVEGHEFIGRAPTSIPPVWGNDGEVLWSEGESFFIVGPPAVGKGTLLQQVALRRAGVLDGDVLGLPVVADRERLTLYLALDRPKQIARSLKRMVSEGQHLFPFAAWEGPLPFDLAKDPDALLEFVQEAGEELIAPVGTVVIDSIKDVATKVSSDEVGGAINRAIGGLVAAGIEVACSHHQRKATSENRKPTKLDDVYGSTWIVAGAGSVVLLWGEPGDPIVELSHLKPPAEEVGPLTVIHDHDRGVSTRLDRPDAWTVLQGAQSRGVSARDVAEAVYGSSTAAQREKARRRLERFVEKGQAVKIEPSQTGDPALYAPTGQNSSVRVREGVREGVTDGSRPSRNPGNRPHAPLTAPSSLPPYVVGGGEREADDSPRCSLDSATPAPDEGDEHPLVDEALRKYGGGR